MFNSRFGLEQYEKDADLPNLNILPIQGGARAGKGETGKAITAALQADGRTVHTIDQGKKFRSLAYLAGEYGVDVEEPLQLERYLGAASTRGEMLDFLALAKTLSDKDEKALLYTRELGEASGKVGKNRLSHGLAVEIMFDEVEAARDKNINTVIIDGRSLDGYVKKMDRQGLGVFIGSFFLECDPVVAARRVRQDFRELRDMPVGDKVMLLEEAEKISKRNDDDAKRDVDPLRYPHHAFSLDLLRGLPKDNHTFRRMTEQIIETKLISVNTSHTTCVEEMTTPIVAITMYMLRAADLERQEWRNAPGVFATPPAATPARLAEPTHVL